MAKHKLFNNEESSPLLQNCLNMTPPSNVHPALLSTVRADVSKSTQVHSILKKNTNISEHATINDASDSDSNSNEEIHNFFSSHNKLPYTKEEDELILNYVLKGENIFKVSSILLWKHLESKKDNPKRTYHSLKNRFMRNIKPNLFSSYGHLIKNETTLEKIFKKFPELKQKMNKRETLSRIILPERSPKLQEDDEVSSTSAQGSQESRNISPAREPDCVPAKQDNKPKQKSPLHLKISSDWYKPETYLRRVKLKKNGMTVQVHFMSRRQTTTSTLGIFQKYQALIEKSKLILCPTCGRRNRPHKVSLPKCSKETDVLIPNSQDTPNASLENLAISKSKKRLNSRSISPSLLSSSSETENSESDALHKSSEMSQVTEPSIIPDSRKNENLEANKPETLETANPDASEQESVSSNTRSRALKVFSVRPNTKSNDSESKNRVTIVSTAKSNSEKRSAERSKKTVEASSSSKNNDSSSGASKRPRDIDEYLESIGEDAIANFRQLIDYEEEQLLVRKCLNKNFKSIGLEGVSHTNWDSYFLESSSDMDTPPLTIDYETDSQINENESATETTASGASLSKNMAVKKRSRRDNKES